MNLHETYDAIAERWHEQILSHPAVRPGLPKLISLLPPSARVLDVGCGSGLIAKELIAAGLRVHGIDPSEGMLAIARRENPTGIFEQKTLEELPADAGPYAAICAVAVLLHLPKASFIANIQRLANLCASQGYLYIVVKGRRADRPEEGMVQQDDSLGASIELFFSFYTQEEVRAACLAVGLEIVFEDLVPSGRATWIEVIAKKP